MGKRGKSHQFEGLGTEVIETSPLKASAMWGEMRMGWYPTAFSSESSDLARRSQLLTWGKGGVGAHPSKAW